jgi:hypothetical protein
LGSQPALGQLGQHLGIALAGDEGLDHGPPRGGQDFGGHRGQLDPGVLEQLLQPLQLRAAHVDLGLAVAGQLPQLTDLGRGHKAGPHHAVSSHIGQPLGIREVGLAARHPLDRTSVAQPHVETVFQGVVRCLPVHAGRLHDHQLYLPSGQPAAQPLKAPGGRREALFLEDHPAFGTRPSHTSGDTVTVHVQTGHPLVDQFHPSLLSTRAIRPARRGGPGWKRFSRSCSQRQSQVPRVLHQFGLG